MSACWVLGQLPSSGLVMPLVICMMPWPQSKEIFVGPVDFHGTEWSACAVPLSTQPIAFSSAGGM